jgi:F0F1-type ATP synthase beta subunit
MFAAESFSGYKGKYVSREDTISGFEVILNGGCDEIPEAYFYMASTIHDVYQRMSDKGDRYYSDLVTKKEPPTKPEVEREENEA